MKYLKLTETLKTGHTMTLVMTQEQCYSNYAPGHTSVSPKNLGVWRSKKFENNCSRPWPYMQRGFFAPGAHYLAGTKHQPILKGILGLLSQKNLGN
jgi:hypothetical protein